MDPKRPLAEAWARARAAWPPVVLRWGMLRSAAERAVLGAGMSAGALALEWRLRSAGRQTGGATTRRPG